MAQLVFMGEMFSGRVYKFAAEKTTVGRANHNMLIIHDSSVSHTHCEILIYGTEVIVRDLGSKNGTYINGVRVQDGQRQLLDGQTVEFGTVKALLKLDMPSDSDTVTDITAMHSHRRHQYDPPEASKNPAAISMTLVAGTPAVASEHTLMLPQPPGAETAAGSPPPAKEHNPWTQSKKTMRVVVVATATIGLSVLGWLLFFRSR